MQTTSGPPPTRHRVLDDEGLVTIPWLMYLNNVAEVAKTGAAGGGEIIVTDDGTPVTY